MAHFVCFAMRCCCTLQSGGRLRTKTPVPTQDVAWHSFCCLGGDAPCCAVEQRCPPGGRHEKNRSARSSLQGRRNHRGPGERQDRRSDPLRGGRLWPSSPSC